jgi:hypothetical protein
MKAGKKKKVPLEYLFKLNIGEQFTVPRCSGELWHGKHLGDGRVKLDGVKRTLQMSRTLPVRREGGGTPAPPLVFDKKKTASKRPKRKARLWKEE